MAKLTITRGLNVYAPLARWEKWTDPSPDPEIVKSRREYAYRADRVILRKDQTWWKNGMATDTGWKESQREAVGVEVVDAQLRSKGFVRVS